MPKAPKTCQGCLFAAEQEIVPEHRALYCKLKETWVSPRDKACAAAEGKPRRRR